MWFVFFFFFETFELITHNRYEIFYINRLNQYYHRISHQPSMAKEDEDINMNVNSIYYICSNCNGSGYVNWSVQPTCATCRRPVLRPITYHPRSEARYLPPARSDSNFIESVSRLLSMASISSSEREEPSSQASQNQGQEESDQCPICFIPLQHALNERGGTSRPSRQAVFTGIIR